jgi:uncharacterized protein YbjT (DUF2867 family)
MSVVAVIGATGAQGGSVVRALSKNPKYKVRALTRTVDSEAAKKLASEVMLTTSSSVTDLALTQHHRALTL